MSAVWDYNPKELKKTKSGQRLLLERLINYGVYRGDKKKIPLKKVKEHWDSLSLEPKRKKFLHRLIWGV